MSDRVKLVVSVILSMAALLFFAVLYGMEIRSAWAGATSGTDPIDSPRAYVATAVAGLVVAIVATALSLPVPPQNGPPGKGSRSSRASRAATFVLSLGEAVSGTRSKGDWKKVLATVYVIVYLGVAVLALVTWAFHTQAASSLVKAQALTFLGMMLAAVRAFLTTE